MSHDYTSVAGQMAGLGEQLKPITPQELIEAFCTGRDAGYSSSSGSTGRDETIKASVSRGFCGYNGRRDTQDSLLTGFDDGYDFMGYLQERGWYPMHQQGDWPYVVYMKRELSVIEYCEADFTLWTFDTPGALATFVGKLRRQ